MMSALFEVAERLRQCYATTMGSQKVLSEAEREAVRLRLRIWEEAQPLLEEQRWRELQALTDEQALRLTKALLWRDIKNLPKRDSSGLVEQQALFRRLASR
jgi:hypothetical protein